MRLIVIVFGFVIAVGVGAVFLFVSAFFDPVTREAGLSSVLAGIFAILDEAIEPDEAVATLGFVIWAAIVAVCAAPLAVAALVGEAAGARSVVWYSGVSGVLAGASPWIARASKGLERAHKISEAEARLALLFFLTGVLTGAIYWLIAAPPRKAAAPAAASDGGESRSAFRKS